MFKCAYIVSMSAARCRHAASSSVTLCGNALRQHLHQCQYTVTRHYKLAPVNTVRICSVSLSNMCHMQSPVRTMCHVAHKKKNDNSTEGTTDTKVTANDGDDTKRESDASTVLQNLSAEDAKRLKILQLEHDMWESTGVRVPDHMTDEMWAKVLFECPSLNSRYKIYKYWFKKEKAIESAQRKKEERQKVHAKRVDELHRRRAEGTLDLKNTYMLFTREATMNKHYYSNLAYAMVHEPTLVFDFGFEEHMTEQEIQELAEQMTVSHGANKVRREPFHFHFCNFNPDGPFGQRLGKSFPAYKTLPISVSSEDYLDLYPHDKLVYLTPNAKTVLKEFNHNDIYIVGGIVDKANEVPLTFAKAKNYNIRMAKFPLDNYMK